MRYRNSKGQIIEKDSKGQWRIWTKDEFGLLSEPYKGNLSNLEPIEEEVPVFEPLPQKRTYRFFGRSYRERLSEDVIERMLGQEEQERLELLGKQRANAIKNFRVKERVDGKKLERVSRGEEDDGMVGSGRETTQESEEVWTPIREPFQDSPGVFFRTGFELG
jgi:hypothetical protein